MTGQKRVAAVHDISCFGRCSLTVALPIISAAGIECSVVPTAVLSTHTGGIDGYTFHDLTDEIMPIVKHWKQLDLQFDAIYTGYLGSFQQLDIVSFLFDLIGSAHTLKVVDPVMADNG
ncbi:MAG: pyridoxal kinase, partial [Caldicoprobacterales bacterium]